MKNSGFSGFEARADADFCFEEFRDRTTGFRGLHGGIEFGFVCAGNFRDKVQMAFRDGKGIADLLERNGRRRLKPAGSHTRAAQLGGKSHRKSTGVCGGE
jgi:hypothetical protein